MGKPVYYNENNFFYNRDREVLNEQQKSQAQEDHAREARSHVGHCTACGEMGRIMAVDDHKFFICHHCDSVLLDMKSAKDLLPAPVFRALFPPNKKTRVA